MQLQILILGICLFAMTVMNDSQVSAANFNDIPANVIAPGCRHLIDPQSNSSDPAIPVKAGECLGIIEGLDYLDSLSCLPRGVTMGQIVRVVIQYIDGQPARLHENFAQLALEAVRKAWPCRR